MYLPKTYTVESVTSGHPDKVCDQISDAILDACLMQDPLSRVAVESFGTHGTLVLGGEVTTNANPDYARVARDVYQTIGYHDPLDIRVAIVKQSPDIAHGVDSGGAGDQGIMYGFATNETPEMLPQGVVLAHRLASKLEELRRSNPAFLWLKPDGKSQVTIDNGRVTAVVVSCQHDPSISLEDVRTAIQKYVIEPIISDCSNVALHINPAGAWHIGGFTVDSGLTGRKIMVDTYGGLIPHGGGAFSGKDATKVDRSAAYMARLAAKSLVCEGKAKQCLVSVAYAIGRAEPVMLAARDEQGKDLSRELQKQFNFQPQAIIECLDLRKPIFQKTAAYGHFGREEFPWERERKRFATSIGPETLIEV
jgi:S-adenosylmethionine synthetase